MSNRTAYGVGIVEDLPLVSQADTKIFKTAPTIAAGDAKWHSDGLISTTPTSKTRTFTSGGTYVPKPGDIITGATSGATAVVMGLRLTSGTHAGGDAAGVLYVEQDAGTFESENLNIGANTNVMTIGGALSSAGVFNEIALGMVAVGVPSAMLQCKKGVLVLHDAAGAEWCDSGATYETEGHHDAMHPNGVIYAGTIEDLDADEVQLDAAAETRVHPVGLIGVVVASDEPLDLGHSFEGTSWDPETQVLSAGEWTRTPTGTISSIQMAWYSAPINKVALNTQGKADVNAETDAALEEALDERLPVIPIALTVAADPGGATAHSNTRIGASNAIGHLNDRLNGRPLRFLDGDLAEMLLKITDYVSATGQINFTMLDGSAAPAAPAEGDLAVID